MLHSTLVNFLNINIIYATRSSPVLAQHQQQQELSGLCHTETLILITLFHRLPYVLQARRILHAPKKLTAVPHVVPYSISKRLAKSSCSEW